MLGISPDMRPGKANTEWIKATFPALRWCSQGHQPILNLGVLEIGYETSVYGRLPFYPKTLVSAAFFRDDWKLDFPSQVTVA